MRTHPPGRNVLVEKLQAVPMLRGMGLEILSQLAQGAMLRSYAPGAVIFLEGDPAPALYYVDAGWVKVVKMSPDGREQILYYRGPGEIFGGVFSSRPVPATALALEATVLWVIPRDAFRQLIAADPALALPVIEFMAERIAELVELVANLSLHTVTARLARLLLDQAEAGVVHRKRWATQAELAARLGTVPDVLSRALRELVDAKLIEVARQQIRILDAPGLAAKAAPPH